MNELNTPVREKCIHPNQRFETGAVKCFIVMLGNVAASRDLVGQLYKRDLLSLYKRSFAGSAWIILSPLGGIVSWIFLHRTHILQPGAVGVPYPAYVLIGSSLWGLFMGVYTAAAHSFTSNQFLLTRVNVSHEALIVVQILQRLTHFALSFVFIVIVLFFFGVVPSWRIVLLPFVIVPLLCVAVGLGLIVSLFAAISFELKKMASVLISLILLVTPVIYAPDAIKQQQLQTIIRNNPFTYLIGYSRDCILNGNTVSLHGYLIVSIASFFFFVVACRMFYVSEDKIIERLL